MQALADGGSGLPCTLASRTPVSSCAIVLPVLLYGAPTARSRHVLLLGGKGHSVTWPGRVGQCGWVGLADWELRRMPVRLLRVIVWLPL